MRLRSGIEVSIWYLCVLWVEEISPLERVGLKQDSFTLKVPHHARIHERFQKMNFGGVSEDPKILALMQSS